MHYMIVRIQKVFKGGEGEIMKKKSGSFTL